LDAKNSEIEGRKYSSPRAKRRRVLNHITRSRKKNKSENKQANFYIVKEQSRSNKILRQMK
jgi:hypothetical protein